MCVYVSSIQVESLRKVYPTSSGAKVAVKSTSLGIPRGECFGLLGINGAGKSSTLAILSGTYSEQRFYTQATCLFARVRACVAKMGSFVLGRRAGGRPYCVEGC